MQTLDIEGFLKRFEFDRNGSYITTTEAAYAINGDILGATQLSAEVIGIGFTENWITWNERKMLWLPAEFRPICLSVSGTTIVLGTASGKVVIVGLSPD